MGYLYKFGMKRFKCMENVTEKFARAFLLLRPKCQGAVENLGFLKGFFI